MGSRLSMKKQYIAPLDHRTHSLRMKRMANNEGYADILKELRRDASAMEIRRSLTKNATEVNLHSTNTDDKEWSRNDTGGMSRTAMSIVDSNVRKSETGRKKYDTKNETMNSIERTNEEIMHQAELQRTDLLSKLLDIENKRIKRVKDSLLKT